MAKARGLVLYISRTLASQQTITKVDSDTFGSIHRATTRVERLIRPKGVDFDAPPPPRKIKELSIPLSLSKSKRDALEKAQSRHSQPQPSGRESFIECSRPEFNLLESQIGLHTPLCSQYWEKNKYKNEWFVIKRKTKLSATQFSAWENAWDQYVPDLLDPLVRESLRDLKVMTPTRVQTQCLRAFPSRYHLFIAAETGSGKTIAYTAPLITRLLQQKRKGIKERALILAVTSSLSIQLSSVVSKLASKTDLIISSCKSNEEYSKDWDVLVGTPGLIENSFRQCTSSFDVKHIILDEADMILDESFVDVLTEIFSLVPIANSVTNSGTVTSGARIIFCSATCTEELECLTDSVVDRQFLRYVRSPKIHSLLPNIEMKFIRIREADKIDRLKELLMDDMGRGELNETMVFCKDRATAFFVHRELQSSDYNAELWKHSSSLNDESTRIFIATDGAARGTDLPRLSHVINYDLSPHTVGFLHRIGRIGRLGSSFPGRVTSFVRKPIEVRLTQAIELAARMGRPLTATELDTLHEGHNEEQDDY